MTRSLRICLVSREYPEETGWGGIGTYHYELAHGLARLGHSVTVLSQAVRREQKYVEADGVTVWRMLPPLRFSHRRLLWRLNHLWDGYQIGVLRRLNRMQAARSFDVIETPSVHGETALYQRFNGRPAVVVRLHTCYAKDVVANPVLIRSSLRLSHCMERLAVRPARVLTDPGPPNAS